MKRLKIICEESNIEITGEALKIIATLSEGAMRDSISILERCVQDGDDKITEEKIKELVGIPKLEHIVLLVEAMLNKDASQALETIEKVLSDGKDLSNFLWEIIKYIRDILVYKTTKKLDIYSENEIGKIEELSQKTTNEALLKLITNLSELENEMKWSTQKTIMFQAGIIKNCMEINHDNIEERVSKIEKQLKEGNIKINTTPTKSSNISVPNKPTQATASVAPKKVITATPGEYVSYWKDVIDNLKNNGKIMLYTNLINTNAKEDGNNLQIEFKNGITAFGKAVLSKTESIQEISGIVEQLTGRQLNLKYIEVQETAQTVDNTNTLEGLDIPINIIEE